MFSKLSGLNHTPPLPLKLILIRINKPIFVQVKSCDLQFPNISFSSVQTKRKNPVTPTFRCSNWLSLLVRSMPRIKSPHRSVLVTTLQAVPELEYSTVVKAPTPHNPHRFILGYIVLRRCLQLGALVVLGPPLASPRHR